MCSRFKIVNWAECPICQESTNEDLYDGISTDLLICTKEQRLHFDGLRCRRRGGRVAGRGGDDGVGHASAADPCGHGGRGWQWSRGRLAVGSSRRAEGAVGGGQGWTRALALGANHSRGLLQARRLAGQLLLAGAAWEAVRDQRLWPNLRVGHSVKSAIHSPECLTTLPL